MLNFNNKPAYINHNHNSFGDANSCLIHLAVQTSIMKKFKVDNFGTQENPQEALAKQMGILEELAKKVSPNYPHFTDTIINKLDDESHTGGNVVNEVKERIYIPMHTASYQGATYMLCELTYYTHEDTKVPVNLAGHVSRLVFYHFVPGSPTAGLHFNPVIYEDGAKISKVLGVPMRDLFYGWIEPVKSVLDFVEDDADASSRYGFQNNASFKGVRITYRGYDRINYATIQMGPYETEREYLSRLITELGKDGLGDAFVANGPDFVLKVNAILASNLEIINENTVFFKEIKADFAAAFAYWACSLCMVDNFDKSETPYTHHWGSAMTNAAFAEVNAKVLSVYPYWVPIWHNYLYSDEAFTKVWSYFLNPKLFSNN